MKCLPRTIVNPARHRLIPPSFKPLALLLLHTPQNSHLIKQQLQRNDPSIKSLQIINIALDSSLGNSISELWLSKRIQIDGYQLKEAQDNGKNWSIKKAQVEVRFNDGDVKMSLNASNSTLFHSGEPYEITVIDPKAPFQGFKSLSSLSIRLPLSLTRNPLHHHDNLIPLKSDTELLITKSAGNLILEINHTSASSFLLKSLKDSGLGQKQVLIYAKIVTNPTTATTTTTTRSEADNTNTYEVVAGGGEWGAKANSLVLKDLKPIDPNDVSKIKFYYIDQSGSKDIDVLSLSDGKGKGPIIYFENVDDSRIGSEVIENGEVVYDGVFGFGSIDGFQVDGVNHKTLRETMVFEIFDDVD